MRFFNRADSPAAHEVEQNGPVAGLANGSAPTRRTAAGRRWAGVVVRIGIVALVLAAAVWAYQANVGSGRPAMDMNMRVTSGATPFPVVVAAAERGRIAGSVVYTGSVAAFNEEEIYPRVPGRIVEMPVYPGDQVRAGQLVARLDDVELASRVSEAEAMAATAQANRAQMEADLVAARHGISQMERELAMVEAELSYARSVAARSERLLVSGAISRQEYENDRALAASLEAKREAARAKLEQARAMEASAGKKLDAAEGMVAQGQAALRTARVVRDYVNIVAPSTGYVVKRLVAPGVLVQPGTAILKIAQIDRVRLQANVGERDLASIRVGSPVTVIQAGGNPAPLTARVSSVFPFVDQGARTAVVEAVVQNSGRRFVPGQYVRLEFVTGERPDAVTVPRGAIARLGDKATVWALDGERVQSRTVTVGLENADKSEITDGLSVGEQVVARGHDGLYAGAPVAVVGGASSRLPSSDQPREPGMPDRGTPSAPSPSPSGPAGQSKGGAHGGH